MLESIPNWKQTNITNRLLMHFELVRPALRLIRLLWCVSRCLVFTGEWDRNFRKYCNSTSQPLHRHTRCSCREHSRDSTTSL